MLITIDTSVIIAILINEPEKHAIINQTIGADLCSPLSLKWEIGNAFSAMFKRNRISKEKANNAMDQFKTIPIRLIDIDLKDSLELAHSLNIYAYDAYMIACAIKCNTPLLTLDTRLAEKAISVGIKTIEV